MKITIDARIISTSTGRYVRGLLEYLPRLDQTNEYVVLLLPEDYDAWQPPAANFDKVCVDAPIYSLAEQTTLLKALLELRADVVHFTMPNQPLLYWRPKVTTVHDLTMLTFRNERGRSSLKYGLKQHLFRLVLWWAVKTSAVIITPTDFVKKQIEERYHTHTVVCTYEAADKLAERPQPVPRLQGTAFLLYVGNAYPHKSLPRLLEAFAQLRQNRPNLQLVCAGKREFYYNRLAEQAQALGVAEAVHILGFIPDTELVWLYQNAAAYVFPSLSEGFGLPGLEAMQYGLPLVSSNATCLPEVYGDAAVYFDPENVDDIAQTIEQVLADEVLQQQLIKTGAKRVNRFSWAEMTEQTLAVYRQASKD